MATTIQTIAVLKREITEKFDERKLLSEEIDELKLQIDNLSRLLLPSRTPAQRVRRQTKELFQTGDK